MKKLKRGLVAFLVGEFFVMQQKDKAFAEKLKKKKGVDKVFFALHALIDFNKDLWESVDTKKGKERFTKKTKQIKKKITQETTIDD